MEDYIKCELSDGGSPRHLNTFSNLFIVAGHYTLTSSRYYCRLPNIELVTASFKALVSLHRKTLQQMF